MERTFHFDFGPLQNFSFEPKELCRKIPEAVLHIELKSGSRYDLTLQAPKVPTSSTSIKDLFKNLTTESVNSLKVFGNLHRPGLRDSDMLWHIELWKNDAIVENTTIHCKAIQGLPSYRDR